MIESLILDISAKISEQVIQSVKREVESIFKDGFTPCYSEKEAAEMLKISVKTLRRERDNGAICYCEYRGKTVFQPHHILDYLARHEFRTGRQSVTLKDTLNFFKRAA